MTTITIIEENSRVQHRDKPKVKGVVLEIAGDSAFIELDSNGSEQSYLLSDLIHEDDVPKPVKHERSLVGHGYNVLEAIAEVAHRRLNLALSDALIPIAETFDELEHFKGDTKCDRFDDIWSALQFFKSMGVTLEENIADLFNKTSLSDGLKKTYDQLSNEGKMIILQGFVKTNYNDMLQVLDRGEGSFQSFMMHRISRALGIQPPGPDMSRFRAK